MRGQTTQHHLAPGWHLGKGCWADADRKGCVLHQPTSITTSVSSGPKISIFCTTVKFSSSGHGMGAMHQRHRQGGDRVLKQAVTGLADHYSICCC